MGLREEREPDSGGGAGDTGWGVGEGHKLEHQEITHMHDDSGMIPISLYINPQNLKKNKTKERKLP